MKRVEIVAVDEKRQITAIFACTLAGKFPTYLSRHHNLRNVIPRVFNFQLTGLFPRLRITGQMRQQRLPTSSIS